MKPFPLCRRTSIPFLLTLATTLATTPPAGAQQAGAARPVKGATVEGITEYTLPNGLRVLLFPDPSKPTMTVNITYLIGSRQEGYGETGMAHLFEHMLFKGSTKHTDIPQELTEHGAFPNGTTWYDRTNYFEMFPATDENLAWALDLEADRMVNSFLRKEDLESEMTVVRNEFESGENSPFNVLSQRIMSTAYLWQGYGRSTIGARSDIENVPIERLRLWYRKFYQPDNAVLTVAGRIDEAHTLSLIEQKFGAIPKPERTDANRIYRTYTREPEQDGPRTVTLRRVGDTQLVMAAWHVPAGSHPDFAGVDALAFILGDSPSGRLYKSLVETKVASRVGAIAYQLAEPGLLLAFAELPEDGSIEAARDALVRTVEETLTKPPSADEVERARAARLKQFELNLNDPNGVGLQISEWAAMGDWRLMFIHRDRLRALDAPTVQRVARSYLKTSNMTLGMFVPTEKPDRAAIPETPPIGTMVAGYRGDTTRVAGEAFDPTPANIDARTRTVSLDNGLKLVMLPKQTRGGSVALFASMRFGSVSSLSGHQIEGDLTGDMLMRGTTSMTRQEIRDTLDRLQARGSVSGSPTQSYARMETTHRNLPAVIGVIAGILRSPAFDPDELEEDRRQRLTALDAQRSEPTVIGSRELSRRINPHPADHPLYTPTLDEQAQRLRGVTVQQLRQFHQRFYGPAELVIAVVGDFDPAAVERTVRETFGDWKSNTPYEPIVSEYHPTEPVDTAFNTPDKANAFFIAAQTLKMKQSDADYPALTMANFILGGGFLNSRLAVRIRQKDGLSYGVGSGIGVSVLSDNATFQTFAIYAPENVDKLEAAFKEELKKAIADGFTAEELAAAKTGWLQQEQVIRAQDAALASTLVTNAYYDRTMEVQADLEKNVSDLTLEQVNAALRKYIDPARMIIIKAGDFTKKPKT